MDKKGFLKESVSHFDITQYNLVSVVDDMAKMSSQARNLGKSAQIFNRMMEDKDCVSILTLSCSLVTAGLKKVLVELVRNNMVDVVVSTASNIMAQDFFEALGYKHYQSNSIVEEADHEDIRFIGHNGVFVVKAEQSERNRIINEICTNQQRNICSSRECVTELGKFLDNNEQYADFRNESILYHCFKKGVPVFIPDLSDWITEAGLNKNNSDASGLTFSIDVGRDRVDLHKIKLQHPETGLFLIGGGISENFVREIRWEEDGDFRDIPVHNYVIKILQVDELIVFSSLNAHDMEIGNEQLVYCDASIALPLISGYAYHKLGYLHRMEKRINDILIPADV